MGSLQYLTAKSLASASLGRELPGSTESSLGPVHYCWNHEVGQQPLVTPDFMPEAFVLDELSIVRIKYVASTAESVGHPTVFAAPIEEAWAFHPLDLFDPVVTLH